MKVFNIKQASQFLNLSESTIYRAIKKNNIPARKVGKQWRIYEESLINWLQGKEEQMSKVKSPKTTHNPNSLKFIDLFCGIGGFRRAAENYNMECVFSSDNDKFVQETYFHWYGDRPDGDIMKFTESKRTLNKIPKFDVLFAGFPCQPFSYAGLNEGFEDRTRGTLFFHVAKIIEHHKPKSIVLENVKGLKSHNKGQTLSIIRETLSELGYVIYDDIINSYHFDIPQYRERWFCVGVRKDLIDEKQTSDFKLYKGNPGAQSKLKDILERKVDNHESLKLANHDIDRIKFHFSNMHKYPDGRVQHNNSKYGPATKKGKYGVYSYLKPDKTLRFHIGDKAKTQIQESYYVHSDTYSPAIIANRRPKLWDIERFLSVKECLKLQAYPETLEFPVSDAQAYKQLGNSVCVTVVDSVIRDMLKLI